MLISSNTTRTKKEASPKGEASRLAKPGARQRLPTHPGAVVARSLKFLGGSIRQHAEAMGLSHWGLNKIASQQSAISTDSALRIARYFDMGETGAELLLGMQMDWDLWQARKELKSALAQIVPVPVPRPVTQR